LGIEAVPVYDKIALGHSFHVNLGVVIERVFANSPAEEVNLTAGDVIVIANNEVIMAVEDLMQVVEDLGIGQPIEITYWRGSQKLTATAILQSQPLAAEGHVIWWYPWTDELHVNVIE
jgi:S1-C subfamily serine protease